MEASGATSNENIREGGQDTHRPGVSSYFQTCGFKSQPNPLCLSFPDCRQQCQTLLGPVWV